MSQKKRHPRAIFLALWLIASWADPACLWAQSPTEQVKATLARVVQILNDPKLEGAAKKKDRWEPIRQTIFSCFDFAEMAKRSLGNHWHGYAARHQELVAPFANLVQDSYLRQVESFNVDRVLYSRERMDQGFAEVNTKLIARVGEELSIGYRLHLVTAEWKIYDVLIDRVSLVNYYRSQFHRVLSAGSFDDLLARLRDRRAREAGSEELRLRRTIPYLLLSIRLR